MKYWNKPFVLEIYIRVTKNCIYTIKIGYGLTIIQKSYVKSPLGFLSFQTSANDTDDGNAGVSIPFGVSALLNRMGGVLQSRLLFQSPLGFLFFQTLSSSKGIVAVHKVSIPFGVSVLPNSISAIPVFMRAKLVICGEKSFFRNISTENPLKTPLSPVFMRCAVKFIFSFIAFIYYNGNFL